MRLSSLFWIFVLVCAASALYSVKYRVKEMDEQIASLQTEIRSTKSALHVLNAEWAYLTRPDRVRKLAAKHLDLQPVGAVQLADVADVPFPEGGAVRVVRSDSPSASGSPIVPVSAPVPQLRPGVVPAGGVGYVR